MRAPCKAPRASAICERFVGSLRRECLDHLLVISGLQLTRILKQYITDFNLARPHTCTPRPAYWGAGCAPVQVSGDSTTETGANGVIAWRAEGGEDDGVLGVERAAPRLPSVGRLGRCWAKKTADDTGSQHREPRPYSRLRGATQVRLKWRAGLDHYHCEWEVGGWVFANLPRLA